MFNEDLTFESPSILFNGLFWITVAKLENSVEYYMTKNRYILSELNLFNDISVCFARRITSEIIVNEDVRYIKRHVVTRYAKIYDWWNRGQSTTKALYWV